MSRTNIEIDDDLVAEAMRRYGLKSKREVVDQALRRFVGPRVSTDEILTLEGIGWDGDLEAMRADDLEKKWNNT